MRTFLFLVIFQYFRSPKNSTRYLQVVISAQPEESAGGRNGIDGVVASTSAEQPQAVEATGAEPMGAEATGAEAKGAGGAKEASLATPEPGATPARTAMYMRDLISRQVKANQLSRAGSLSDSTVLRRKGRLKEQDPFIEFVLDLFKTHETEEALDKTEKWLNESMALPVNKRKFSNLYRQVPKLGYYFHPLPLRRALGEYDEFCALTKRRYVRPNFAEVRHIINIAQVHASARDVKLVTFDADGTLYADGKHFEEDNKMIDKIIQLMEIGIHVAIVTAAGYPGDAKRFEGRLQGLLDAFKVQQVSEEVGEHRRSLTTL